MNAPAINNPVTPTSRFLWLLKREFWEHRGGFFRGPLVAGGVVIAVTLLSMIVAEATAARNGINLSNMNLGAISRAMTPEQIAKFNAGLSTGLMGLSFPIAITLAFVVFFYLLGALYDDRKDRSVLFWKSLPISDLETVLSKIATAVIVAPVIAIVAMIVLQFTALVLLSIYAGIHGVNPLPLLWNPVPLVSMWLKLLFLIPLNALWALPTVGWLLLCSAFARSKPFLWAVAVPVALGVIIGFTQLLQQFSIPTVWYWKNIVFRILLGVVPGSWFGSARDLGAFGVQVNGDNISIGAGNYDFLNSILSWDRILGALVSTDMWIGAAAGAVMTAAAIYFRRKRTEAFS